MIRNMHMLVTVRISSVYRMDAVIRRLTNVYSLLKRTVIATETES